ncbi:MAG: hypothetical protein ACLTMP_09150, partial [Eggerthella lenta]
EQGSTTKKRSHTTALRLCTRVLLSAVLACALLIPVTAEEAHASDQPRIVKVGYTDSEGLLTKNDDGTYEGYTYDYLMRIAQFTGWSFEFVEAEGDNANERALRLLEMLDNGEVDIEGSMSVAPPLPRCTNTRKQHGSAPALFAPNIHATVSKTNLFTRSELRVAILATTRSATRARVLPIRTASTWSPSNAPPRKSCSSKALTGEAACSSRSTSTSSTGSISCRRSLDGLLLRHLGRALDHRQLFPIDRINQSNPCWKPCTAHSPRRLRSDQRRTPLRATTNAARGRLTDRHRCSRSTNRRV